MKIKRSSYHLSYYHILLFISHLWSGIDSELLPGYHINVPHRVTVQRGLCVYIPCNFTVPKTETLTRNAKGIWYNKNEQIVASKRNGLHFPNKRFFLAGDVWRGDCSLYIENPLYEDRYRFRVEDNIEFSYRDIKPYVDVTELKSKPEISPIKSWIDGEEVTLSCTSPGTCVQIKPQITWGVNIKNVRVGNKIINHENGTKTHFSTITFTARKEQNNSPLSCIVQLKGGLTTAQQITMKVEYPLRAPEIKCSIINKEPKIPSSSGCTMDANNTIYPLEGSWLSLTCSADRLPTSSLGWKSSNGTLTSFSTVNLTFINVSLTAEGIYTCQATNTYESKETSVTMKILYSPRFVDGRCHKVENRLECTCLIQSFPEPTLKWKHNGVSYNNANHMNDKISIFTGKSKSGTNSTLTLQINTGESQNIQCVASNIHGELVLELFNETAQLTSKAFPSAAIFAGCFAAVLIVTGVLLIIFYRKRKMMQNKEASMPTHDSVVENIYDNSEMFSNGLNEVGKIPQQDHQPPPEDGSVDLNCENVQYMSVNFSKLKPKVTATESEAEEVEYSVVKRTA
ncbi:sialic acid-binding Ig-like lectin 14 isoform X1 [Lithobates pipiens]